VYAVHHHSSPPIENQGQRPRSKVRLRVTVSKDDNTVGLSSVEGSFFLVIPLLLLNVSIMTPRRDRSRQVVLNLF